MAKPTIQTHAADISRTPRTIPLTLELFDSLPDSGNVRLPVVQALYGGISRSSVWRNCKKGHIPAPIKLTPHVTAWNVGELRKALGAAS